MNPRTVLRPVDGRVKPGHDEAQRDSPYAFALLLVASVMLLPVAASSQPATSASPAASGPTSAPATPGWTQKSGKELAAECHSGDAVKRASCTAYITGIYDLQFAPTPPPGVCPPANLNSDNLAAVVTAYIDTHEDGTATAAIAQSIVRFFPCAAQEPRRR